MHAAVLLVSDLLAGWACYDLLTPAAGFLSLSRLWDSHSSLQRSCSLLVSATRSTHGATSKWQQAAAKLDALLNAAASASEYNDAPVLDEPQCVASSGHLHERGAPGATAPAESVRHYWGRYAIHHQTPSHCLRLIRTCSRSCILSGSSLNFQPY